MKFVITQIALIFAAISTLSAQVELRRLNNGNPIISIGDMAASGASAFDAKNLNGPSVVALPEWLPREKRLSPKANYYLYFGHHNGSYIRMAWAEAIEGKWHIYNCDSTRSKETLGVLSMYSPASDKKEISLENGITIGSHIASPIVIVDNDNKKFVLYFHGMMFTDVAGKRTRIDQNTFVVTSDDGLRFNSEDILPASLAKSYFAPFFYNNHIYGFNNGGGLHRSPEPIERMYQIPSSFDFSNDLWSVVNNSIFSDAIENYKKMSNESFDSKFGVRHVTALAEGDTLHILFSTRYDKPERIYYTSLRLDENYPRWRADAITLAMCAQRDWEGGSIEPTLSQGGSANSFINEVRDPFLFRDKDGELYLFYCAGGERGIGVASIRF